MTARLSLPARAACAAAVIGLLGGAASYAIMAAGGTAIPAPLTTAAFAALGGATARLGGDFEAAGREGQAPTTPRRGGWLIIATTLLLALALGAFLGAGKTTRPDRISLPDGVVYGVLVVAAACVAFSIGRLVALSRGGQVTAYGGALVVAALCGATLGLGYAGGFGLVMGSPCPPYRHCYSLDANWWMVALRLVPLASLYGLGLGVAACAGMLVGRLPFMRPRRPEPAAAT